MIIDVLTLAIDTSGLVAGAALVSESGVLAEFCLNNKLTHSQTLMPLIDDMFRLSEINPESVDYISCAGGPGSFTGLRIGAAAAKGLAFGLGKKIVPVPTLDALAYNIFEHDSYIVPIMDARRNQVYSAIYRYDGEKPKRLSEYIARDIHELLDYVKTFGARAVFLGDGVPIHSETIKANSNCYCFASRNNNVQRASSVGALSIDMFMEGGAISPMDFSPFYLRPPQAERELKENER